MAEDSHVEFIDSKEGNQFTVRISRPLTATEAGSNTDLAVSSGKKAVSSDEKAHRHAYRPDVKTCTFRVSRHDSHRKVVAKVEHMKGVMDTKWNPRTREVTVIYDAKVTSARHIRHFMA